MHLRSFFLAAICLLGAIEAGAQTLSVTPYPIPSANSAPSAITPGPDGGLWFTEYNTSKIGHITTLGTITEITTGIGPSICFGVITAGPDGNIWAAFGNQPHAPGPVLRISTAGVITGSFTTSAPSSCAESITKGPDGQLWLGLAVLTSDTITSMNTSGVVTSSYVIPPGGGPTPYGIVTGPDGALWFTEYSGFSVTRMDTAGNFSRYLMPGVTFNGTSYSGPGIFDNPDNIIAGPDGNLWFTEFNGNRIARITTAGAITEYPLPTASAFPTGLTVGPDHAIWFTESGANQIGRITTAGTITEFALPAGQTGPGGIALGSDGALWFTLSSNSIGRGVPGPATPGPVITSVVNAYNPQAQVSPGSVVVVTGNNFGSNPVNLSVSVGGKAAYVYPLTVTPTQFTMEIPTDAKTGPTTVTAIVNGQASTPYSLTLVAFAPACQTQDGSGSGLGQVNAGTHLVTLTGPAHPGDQLTAVFTGLGPTTPNTPTGLAAAANPVTTVPTLTIGGVAATGVSAAVVTGSAGAYLISFTVPAGVQGTSPLVASVGGASSSDSCTIALAGLSSIVNNASFANPGVASPGAIVTAFANSLGTTTDQLSGVFPSASSEGVHLSFNNEGGPMFHIVASTAQQQVDLLVPTDLPTSGTVNVQLNSYPNYTLTMVPANPGLYRIPDPAVKTRFNVIAQFANTTWLALPVSTTTVLGLPACTPSTGALVLCGQPAMPRDYLVIYATGLGIATPGGDPKGSPLPTGQVAPADGSTLYKTPTLPTVTVGGVQAQILFSGLAPGFAGLYQIDIQVPDGVANSDDVAVKVTMAGASDTATIAIQPR